MKAFHLGAASGVIATAAQANDVLFAWRNAAANVQHIQQIRARLSAVAPPTADGEFGIALALATFGDDYTDGQNLSDPATAANYAVRNRSLDKARVLSSSWRAVSSLASGNVRIANTADLTAGATGPTIDAHAFESRFDRFEAIATAVQCPVLDLAWCSPGLGRSHDRSPGDDCIPLETSRGFVIRAPLALPSGMTVRLTVSVDWLET